MRLSLPEFALGVLCLFGRYLRPGSRSLVADRFVESDPVVFSSGLADFDEAHRLDRPVVPVWLGRQLAERLAGHLG